MDVAETAFAALGNVCGLAVAGQVGDDLAGLQVADGGAHRHAQRDVFGRRAVAVRATALFAVTGAVDALEAVFDQGVDIAVRNGMDAAAVAAVAAVRPAARDEFLAPERGDAVPALAGMDLKSDFVDEFQISRDR